MSASKKYRHIFLLTISGKIFGILIKNSLYPYILQNIIYHCLINNRFKAEDSCIIQLLLVTHETDLSLNEDFELRGVFLHLKERYISNDKVCHYGSIYKLCYSGVSRKLLDNLIDFLS